MTVEQRTTVGRRRPRTGSTRALAVLVLAAALAAPGCAFAPTVCGEWQTGQGGPPRIRTRSHELCALSREAVGTEFKEITALSDEAKHDLYALADRAPLQSSTDAFLDKLTELGAPGLATRLRGAITYANERSARPDDAAEDAAPEGRLRAVRHGLLIGLDEWFPQLRRDPSD